MMPPKKHFDFIIIGSGFGGSISAMRLAQKGYSVAVIEKGRRFRNLDFAKTNWNLPRFFWAPLFRCFGIQQITLLKGVMVLHGTGVGGGSLVYANTMMQPRDSVFQSSEWPLGADWKSELAAHYQTVKKMLGVEKNKLQSEVEPIMKNLAKEMGVEDSFHLTDVAVYFGKAGETVRDPYFQGQGPDRTGCTGCGACMVGCRVGAKNTLDKNYLYFAEKWGAEIYPEMQVKKITPVANGYEVATTSVSKWWSPSTVFYGQKVIVAAGVMGTVKLLLKNKLIYKTLPALSDQLGQQVKTNGESLCGVTSFETHRDLSRGIAIGSAFYPDEFTKIEPVRYNKGSSVMRHLAVPMTPDGNNWTRPLKMYLQMFLQFPQWLRFVFVKNWAAQSIILLVMQSVNQPMRLILGRSLFTLGRKSLVGDSQQKIPSYLPLAQLAAQKLAKQINGFPQNAFSEVLLGIPATAHILGGCVMGTSKNEGVTDSNHEVFGYPGLYVCDGSVVPVNLGVNPSLTISALAERFSQKFPVKNDELFQQRQLF